MVTTHRLIVLPAPAVLCKISYSGSDVSNRSSIHNAPLMETLESYGITQATFSTAISSVLYANFWLRLSIMGDGVMAMSRTTSLLFSPGKDFARLHLYQVSYILFTPCFKVFNLVIFLTMLCRLRPNTMRKFPFQRSWPHRSS